MKTLSIFITKYCNLKCDFCYTNAEYRVDSNNSDERDLSLDQWEEIFEEARLLGYTHLHIFGGEPFYYRNLREFCIRARKYEFSILIATNGISFRDNDFEWVRNNEIQISFTINEINQQWNELSPIKRQNLENLQRNGIQFSIATCLTQKNYQYYLPFITELQNHGIYGYFGIYYSPIGRAANKMELVINPKIWMNFVENMKEKMGIRIEQSFIPKDEKDLFPWISSSCPINSGEMITITSEGEIFPCFLLIRPEKVIKKWQKKGDFGIALSMVQSTKTSILYACPAYFDEKGIDFRFNLLNSEEKKYIELLCPLISL